MSGVSASFSAQYSVAQPEQHAEAGSMKCPEHMSWEECHEDRSLTDDEKRAACVAYLEELDRSDLQDFFEEHFDPDGPFRYGGDEWDALRYFMQYDLQRVFDACQQDARDNP